MNAQFRSLLTLCLLASAAHAHVLVIADEEAFNQHVGKSDKNVVVKFAAEWCGVCKNAKQPFEDLSKEDEFKDVVFAHVDIDKSKALADKHKVGGVPTFVFFAHGNKVGQEVGVQNMKGFKEEMRNHIHKHLPKNAHTSVDAQEAHTSQDITKVDESAPAPAIAEPDKAEVAGIVQSIVNAVKWVIAVIVGLVQYTIDAIKGLFASR